MRELKIALMRAETALVGAEKQLRRTVGAGTAISLKDIGRPLQPGADYEV